MPDALVREMLEAYMPHKELCCKLEGETGQFFLHPPAHFLPLSMPDFEIASPDDFFARYPHAPISKASIFTADNSMPHPLPEMGDKVACLQYAWYEELCLPGESKASGIAHLIDALGIPRENTLAFGDSENDRAMLSFAAVSVAMATAPADLRALATRGCRALCGAAWRRCCGNTAKEKTRLRKFLNRVFLFLSGIMHAPFSLQSRSPPVRCRTGEREP